MVRGFRNDKNLALIYRQAALTTTNLEVKSFLLYLSLNSTKSMQLFPNIKLMSVLYLLVFGVLDAQRCVGNDNLFHFEFVKIYKVDACVHIFND